MTPDQPTPTVTSTLPTKKPRSKLTLVLLTLSTLLLVGLIISIFLWKPWQPNIKAGERTVTVSGTATVKSTPDEFVFYPSYSFTNNDKQAALAEMTKKSEQIVAELKKLGVPDNKIKTDSSGYGDIYYPSPDGSNVYNLDLTVTVSDKTMAQKVQDYLLTTSPTGSVTPQASFSTAKQKTLESQARDQAEQDAKSKADQSAKNLGFKVTKVKNVQDGGFDNYGGCGGNGLCNGANLQNSALDNSSSSKLSVQPGENELPYSVNVTYYIR